MKKLSFILIGVIIIVLLAVITITVSGLTTGESSDIEQEVHSSMRY